MKMMSIQVPNDLHKSAKELAESLDTSVSQVFRESVLLQLYSRGRIEPFEFRLIMEECGVKYE